MISICIDTIAGSVIMVYGGWLLHLAKFFNYLTWIRVLLDIRLTCCFGMRFRMFLQVKFDIYICHVGMVMTNSQAELTFSKS